MRKKIILRHRNFNKQKTGQAKRAFICRQAETGQAKRAVILVGILALGLILLAGCRQRPKEEEMVPLEPMAERATVPEEEKKVKIIKVDTDGDGIPDTWITKPQ